MASFPQSQRVVKPATCNSTVVRHPIAPCELLPHGLPGVLEINGTHYVVEVLGYLPEHGEPVLDGYRLVKPDGTCHDLCMVHGALECSCGDYVWRRQARDPKGCKHCQAVRRHFAQPVDQRPALDAIDLDALADGEALMLSGPEIEFDNP
jgi:hypothetical protein